MAALFSPRFNLNECIEKAFFRTIVIIALISCTAVILFDLLILGGFASSVHLTALFILVLLVMLYVFNSQPFARISTFGLLTLCLIFTYRGLTTDDFNPITYMLIITIGFVNSLVSRQLAATILTIFIFVCLLAMLFKEYSVITTPKLIRQAIPYLGIFFIVTICSAFLKKKYENNQLRLKEMVGLLNQKNQRIVEQNILLRKKFGELEELNQNLETIISQKTAKITEKNGQLADIAYANAHTIRGPLARILGLLNLMNMDEKNRDFYICKLHKEALDMDEVLLVVTKQIEMNISKSKFYN